MNNSILALVALGSLLAAACADRPVPPDRGGASDATATGAPAVEARVEVGENHPIVSRSAPLPLVEPHVSAHPTDPDHLLVAAIVVTNPDRPYESGRLASFVSRDSGRTWAETTHDYHGYDPWTAILDDGSAVMTWIGTPGRFEDKYPVVFFNSPDGGGTWSREVQVLPGPHDGTKLAAGGGKTHFTTVHFREDHSVEIRLYERSGSGPFVLAAAIDGAGERLGFAQPALLADGTVVVPAVQERRRAWVQTWRSGAALSEPMEITRRLGGGKGYTQLVSDRGGSRFRDRLYFVRAAGYDGAHDGIWLNASADAGRTWSADTRVDRFDAPGSGRALVPSAAVNRDGVVAVTWVDAQGDPSGALNDLYVAVSLDGGGSFGRPVKVTTAASDPRTPANADVAAKFPGGGHYLGLTARADGAFQAVWSDSRDGAFALRTATIRVGT